jgi:hypothetical protein
MDPLARHYGGKLLSIILLPLSRLLRDRQAYRGPIFYTGFPTAKLLLLLKSITSYVAKLSEVNRRGSSCTSVT